MCHLIFSPPLLTYSSKFPWSEIFMILSTYRNSIFIRDCKVSFPVLQEENFVTKLFVMIIKFMKITKIFDHGDLELYGIGHHET